MLWNTLCSTTNSVNTECEYINRFVNGDSHLILWCCCLLCWYQQRFSSCVHDKQTNIPFGSTMVKGVSFKLMSIFYTFRSAKKKLIVTQNILAYIFILIVRFTNDLCAYDMFVRMCLMHFSISINTFVRKSCWNLIFHSLIEVNLISIISDARPSTHATSIWSKTAHHKTQDLYSRNTTNIRRHWHLGQIFTIKTHHTHKHTHILKKHHFKLYHRPTDFIFMHLKLLRNKEKPHYTLQWFEFFEFERF